MIASSKKPLVMAISSLLTLGYAQHHHHQYNVEGRAILPILRGNRGLQAVPTGGYLGCFQDDKTDPEEDSRIFELKQPISTEMDAEYCKALCDGQGFDYYGTQFGRECWCGAGTPATTYLRYGELTDDDCSIPCTGDATEMCGGHTIMSVYAFDDADSPTPSPVDEANPSPVTTGTCSNGLPGYSDSNENGEACCPLECGLCGGVDCSAGYRKRKKCCINGVLNYQPPCSVSNVAPCVIDDYPVISSDSCSPNPCNSGSCTLDPGGGHICTCPSGWGGMGCQISTAGLSEFSIELNFTINNNVDDAWGQADTDEFRSYADRWEDAITHVSCGDGILVIEAQWAKKFVVTPPEHRSDCPGISDGGKITVSRGLQNWKNRDDVWDSFIMHGMGHAIGIGYLWGKCIKCVVGGEEPRDGSWDGETCPAAYETWLQLSGEPAGTVADIIETESPECIHWAHDKIPGELINKGTTHVLNEGGISPLSKLTLAAMEDIGYVVDPSKAEPYQLS